MEEKDKTIEIPFGAQDSELRGFEYTIPDGFEAEIRDGKVIVRKIESEDESIRKAIIELLKEVGRDDTGISENAKCMIAYLEKQKENPKTADSIPSDCASDAKCEDRWHKVGDSLPDNGRLVLANDCLGNTLLARYDGEGNWEVSVYDNDDYYCRNTITKWCDIPSEKQKEQKQEQKEVDLEKEIIRYQREDMDRDTTVGDVARHFYELGLKAKEENK